MTWKRVNHLFGRTGLWHLVSTTRHDGVSAVCGVAVYSARRSGVQWSDSRPDEGSCAKCTQLAGKAKP